MSRLLCSICTGESNSLHRYSMLSWAIINLSGFLSLVFLIFSKGSDSKINSMSRLLCSIFTSESNSLHRDSMLSWAIINLSGFLSLVFLIFSKGSD